MLERLILSLDQRYFSRSLFDLFSHPTIQFDSFFSKRRVNGNTHGDVRFRGEHLEAVHVRFRSPVLRVLLRPILSNALVTAVAHEQNDHNHPAEHRPARTRAAYRESEYIR